MTYSSRLYAITFLLLFLSSSWALADEFPNPITDVAGAQSPGVKDINTDPLTIHTGEGSSQTLATTLGGASLTVNDSDITIEGTGSSYSAGLAGYNAPLANGQGIPGPATSINGSVITIVNGNLTSGMDSEAKAPGSMNIKDTIINLQGVESQDAVIYGFGLDKDAGQIINIIQESTINVGQDKKGTILANYGTVNLDANSKIILNPNSTLSLTAGSWPGSSQTITPSKANDNITRYNIGGAWQIGQKAVVNSENPTHLEINLENGSHLTVQGGGSLDLQNGTWNDGATLNANGNIEISGANANVWVGQLNIGEGADISIGSTNTTSSGNWAVLSGYKGVSISGGNIALNPGAEIQGGSAKGMQISGGSITLAGEGGAGKAGSSQLRFSREGQNAISGGSITVAAGKQGSIGTGQKLDMTGGVINVNGTLDIAGKDIGSGGFGDPASFSFNMTGGQFVIAESGSLAIKNEVNMNVGGNAVINNNGSISIIGGEKASSLILASGSNLAGGKITTGAKGQLQLGDPQNGGGGDITSNISADTGGKISVAKGDWILGAGKTINVGAGGALQIGGQGAASLDVRAGKFENTADVNSTDGTVSSGVGVMANGKLLTNFDQLFRTTDAALLDSVKQIYLDATGAITIAKVSDSIEKVTLEQLGSYKTALLANGSAGSVNWQDVVVGGNPVSGKQAEAILGDTILASNDISYDKVTDGRVTVADTASIGGQTLVLQGDAAAASTLQVGDGVTPGRTLTLLGHDANTQLLKAGSENGAAAPITQVVVNPGNTLALGSDDVAVDHQGGRFAASVTLDNGSTLQTAGKGDFSTGPIKAQVNAGNIADASVIVKAGSSLTAPVVGEAGAPINQIQVGDLAKLTVAGDIIGNTVSNAGALVANSLTASSFVNTGGSVDLGSLTLGQDATSLHNISSGAVNIGNLTLKGALLAGKSQEGAGSAPTLNVGEANLAQGRLIINNAASSAVAANSIKSLGNNGADFDVMANSILTVGDAPADWVAQALAKTGLSASPNGAINSVLAVYSPITMKAGGAILVGDMPTPAEQPVAYAMQARNGLSPLAGAGRETLNAAQGNRLTLGNGSTLLVNGPAAATGRGAILPSAPAQDNPSGNAILEVSSGAKIAIADARPQTTYVIFGRNANDVGWDMVSAETLQPTTLADNQLVTDNPMLQNLSVAQLGNGTLTILSGAARAASDVFPGLDSQLAAVLDQAFANDQIGVSPRFTQSGARGTQFLSRALVMANNGKADKAARALESAGRMIAIGAVPQMTLAANEAAGSAITQRTTLAEPMGNMYTVNANGERVNRAPRAYSTALWIMPLFQSTNGFSMSAGPHDYDYSGTLGGVALGADYTINDAARVGLAFNIGGGYAEGSGTLNKTTNNMNFWGIGAYAAYNQENFGLTADVFYTSSFNSLRQNTPGEMDFGKLKADVNGQAISTGLRAEYKIPTDAMDIVPHAGFRYTNLVTDSYKIKREGTVIKGDSMEQNIWQFPVGVTMTRLVQLDQGWRFKPMLDLHVTPAAGDFKAKGKVRFTGTDSKAKLKTKTMDYITYGGTVGLEFSTDQLSLGLSYSGEFGEETSAHGVFGTFRYEF